MNFYDYIGVTPDKFESEYVGLGFVQRQKHKQFPLDIFTYTRKTVHEALWDNVTSRCRGIVVHRDTGEVIARPFEKFHNHGSTLAAGLSPASFSAQPVIWEKVDGFMCTLYRWEGVPYIASKGSFTSIHAKWATAWYRKNVKDIFPVGCTPVFEGIHPDLRIVVNYGTDEGLVLLSVINNETGDEVLPEILKVIAEKAGVETPEQVDMTWERAEKESHEKYDDGFGTEEGYVLTWYQKGKPPARLKMKFDEYCRLHRIVTGVSPKRIWQELSEGNEEELKDWMEKSTPWFAEFAKKWVAALTESYREIEVNASTKYEQAKITVLHKWAYVQDIDFIAIRKDYAAIFNAPENVKYAPVLFAMLDKKDIRPTIWRLVKHLTANSKPMIDAHAV